MKVALALLVSFLAIPAFGAVAIHGTATGACATSVNSVTFARTVAAGSNLVMIVGATSQNNPHTQSISTLTFNGDNFDGQAVVDDDGGTPNIEVEMWTLKNPDVATGNVIITWSGVMTYLCGGAVALSGVDLSGTPYRTPNSAGGTSGTSASINVTSVAGDIVVDATGSWLNSTAGNEGAGQTTQISASTTTNLNIDMSTETAGGVSTTMSYTVTEGDFWMIGGLSFIPAAASTAGRGPLLGVGP